jgi:tRNA threonylcarbamoyladenosine biosynthesis protein TsaE
MIISMADTTCTIDSASVEQTLAIGRRIGETLVPRTAIALIGGLAAGKTQLVKGIAAGAGVDDPARVSSPTFVIVNEYAARIHLYHVDAYRLSGPADLAAIGLEEMLASESVVIVEWADRVAEILPEARLTARLTITGDTHRRLEFEATGPAARRLVAALTATFG